MTALALHPLPAVTMTHRETGLTHSGWLFLRPTGDAVGREWRTASVCVGPLGHCVDLFHREWDFEIAAEPPTWRMPRSVLE